MDILFVSNYVSGGDSLFSSISTSKTPHIIITLQMDLRLQLMVQVPLYPSLLKFVFLLKFLEVTMSKNIFPMTYGINLLVPIHTSKNRKKNRQFVEIARTLLLHEI